MALILAARDPAFFVEEFVWTYDPREDTPFIPFTLFEKQREALRWILDCETRGVDGIIEKSRDAGATWLTAAYAVHRWLFRPGAAIGFGSRKLDLVDALGDPKTIFDKIRTIIRNLPSWLLLEKAYGFDPKIHDNFCKIINPANGSTITGEGGDEIGRGGRTLIYFVDEAAFLPRPLLVDQALSANAKTKIFVSTPRGSNNPFAAKRMSGTYPVYTLHWKDDERKTRWVIVPETWEPKISPEGELIINDEDIRGFGKNETPVEMPENSKIIYPWYENILLKYDPVTVAQEYEIDYSASLEGVIIPAVWLRSCVGLNLPESNNRVAGFDVAAGGNAENVYISRGGPVVRNIIRWKEDDPTAAAIRVVDYGGHDEIKRLFYDVVGVGAGVGGAIKLTGQRAKFRAQGVNTGVPPTLVRWPDGMTSKEKFVNLKAELWFRLRSRVEKTYRYVTQGVDYPPEELLSLPVGNDTEALIAQLSNVRYFETETGKIMVETKKQLRDRGVPSPDIAEALVLSFSPGPAISSKPTAAGSSQTGGTPRLGPQVTPFTIVDPRRPTPTPRRRGNSA